MDRHRISSAALAAALTFSFAATAGGADDGPAPQPCDGVVQITDPAADSHHPNVDVTRAWFAYGGAGKATLNIEVADLGPAVDHTENDRVLWRGIYSDPSGVRRYVQATVARGQTTATFEHGRATGTSITREGETTGRLVPGKSGVVSVALPASVVEDGRVLGHLVVIAAEANALSTSWFDRAPGGTEPGDTAATPTGADWRISACGASSAAPPSTSTSGPGTTVATALTAVTLERDEVAARYGRTITLRGRVAPAAAGVPVDVVDERGGVLGTATTNADGTFAFRVRVLRSARLAARAGDLTSASVQLAMVPEVTLAPPRAAGGSTIFSGTVAPRRLSGPVTLERRAGRQWVAVGFGRLRDGRFSVRLAERAHGRHRISFQAGSRSVHAEFKRSS